MSGKNESNKNLMKFQLIEGKNQLTILINKIKISFFYLFNELLKDYKTSIIFECISIILQYSQIMYYPFEEFVRIILKLFIIVLFRMEKRKNLFSNKFSVQILFNITV